MPPRGRRRRREAKTKQNTIYYLLRLRQSSCDGNHNFQRHDNQNMKSKTVLNCFFLFFVIQKYKRIRCTLQAHSAFCVYLISAHLASSSGTTCQRTQFNVEHIVWYVDVDAVDLNEKKRKEKRSEAKRGKERKTKQVNAFRLASNREPNN